LDILATDKEALVDLYDNFDTWILEYDKLKLLPNKNVRLSSELDFQEIHDR